MPQLFSSVQVCPFTFSYGTFAMDDLFAKS
jgi:hypothetical protein